MRSYGVLPLDLMGRLEALSPRARFAAMVLRGHQLSNMAGLYRLPVGYLAEDLGCSPDEAEEALVELEKAGDIQREKSWVWVIDMAAMELRVDKVSPRDNRLKSIHEVLAVAPAALAKQWAERYLEEPLVEGLPEGLGKAPPKPGSGSETGSGSEEDQDMFPSAGNEQEDPRCQSKTRPSPYPEAGCGSPSNPTSSPSRRSESRSSIGSTTTPPVAPPPPGGLGRPPSANGRSSGPTETAAVSASSVAHQEPSQPTGNSEPCAGTAPPSTTRKSPSSSPKTDPLLGFDEWYRAYPRKQARKDGEKAWKQTAKARPPTAELIRLLQAQHLERRDRQYIPLPASWLRGERWNDEVAATGGTVSADVILAREDAWIREHLTPEEHDEQAN